MQLPAALMSECHAAASHETDARERHPTLHGHLPLIPAGPTGRTHVACLARPTPRWSVGAGCPADSTSERRPIRRDGQATFSKGCSCARPPGSVPGAQAHCKAAQRRSRGTIPARAHGHSFQNTHLPILIARNPPQSLVLSPSSREMLLTS